MWQRTAVDHNGTPYVQMVQKEMTPTSDTHDLLNATVNHRPAFAHTTVELKQDQQVVANAGTMIHMEGPGQVALSFENGLPGDILPFAVTPGAGWVVATSSFVCGTTNIKVSAKFAGCAMCLCGGEGPFLTHITSTEGKALFYAGSYGQIQRIEVPKDTTALVHTGLFFAASDATSFEVGMPGNCKSLCCSGEGFVLKFHGPAVVYVRNRDPAEMLRMLNPLPAPPSGGDGGGGAGGGGA